MRSGQTVESWAITDSEIWQERVLVSPPRTKQSWLYTQAGGQEAGKQPHRKRSGSLGWWQVACESTVCPGGQKGQPCPGMHQVQHHKPVEGGGCEYPHCTGAALPCAVWSASVQEGHQSASGGEQPRRWKVLRARLRRRVWGHLPCSACWREGWGVTSSQSTTSSREAVEEEGLIYSLVASRGLQGMKLHQEKFRLGIMKRFFTKRVVSHWNTVSTGIQSATRHSTKPVRVQGVSRGLS